MLQKLAYLVVIFVLLPLIVIMGFAMSPWLNAVLAGWVDIVGGRQSARSIHFIVAWLLVRVRRHPRFPGDRHRSLEQPALDDHRPLPGARGGPHDRKPFRLRKRLPRRAFLARATAAASALALAGCDSLSRTEWFPKVLEFGRAA